MTDDDQEAPRRRGRPAMPPEDRKSANLKFRTRPILRERIEAAAVESGRTVSEEVEYRLEQSFEIKGVIKEAAEVVAEIAVEKLVEDWQRMFGGKEMFWAIQHGAMTVHTDMQNFINNDPRFAVWYKDEDSEIYKIMEEIVLEKVQQLLKYVSRHKRGLTYAGTKPTDS